MVFVVIVFFVVIIVIDFVVVIVVNYIPYTFLLQFRDRYEREKRTANATVMSLQNTLDLSKKKILKEEEWKQTTDSVRKQLVQEKQDLLTRLYMYKMFLMA